jgi:hypothetical protein
MLAIPDPRDSCSYGHLTPSRGDDYTERAVVTRTLSLVMLFLAVVISMWGGYNFQKRAVYLE